MIKLYKKYIFIGIKIVNIFVSIFPDLQLMSYYQANTIFCIVSESHVNTCAFNY